MHNSSRIWLERENAAFAKTLPPGSRVLDAGAGEQPYKTLFAHCTYEAADFEAVDKPYAKSDYVCDLIAIPVEDQRFDGIIFNQVMEHLPDPLAALKELRRTLKPGGTMICTAPFYYQEHEIPYDFFRYTQFGWRSLLERAGMEVVRIGWLEGYLGTLSYQLRIAVHQLPSSPAKLGAGWKGYAAAALIIPAKLIFRGLAVIFSRLDEGHRLTGHGHPKNYVVIARRVD
jgi:SAM-dependent methyltransferase